MDYQKYFSDDVPSFLRSPVREIFRKVDLSAICSFAGGYPAAITFPVEDIRRLSGEVLEKYGTKALQYGATQGVPELREALAARYGVPVSQVQITTSSQQGIDVCTRVFVNPGDIVLSNDPTYLGALQSFRAYRARVMSVEAYRACGAGTPPEIASASLRPLPFSALRASLGPSLLSGRGWPEVCAAQGFPVSRIFAIFADWRLGMYGRDS